MTFTCGCQPPTYCPTHRPKWRLIGIEETDVDGLLDQMSIAGEAYMRIGRFGRSVTLDARATPTRNRSDV